MSKEPWLSDSPHRCQSGAGELATDQPEQTPVAADKFRHVAANEKVQFNKRVTRRVADGYEILAIRTRRKVPDLLAEALSLLEKKYDRF